MANLSPMNLSYHTKMEVNFDRLHKEANYFLSQKCIIAQKIVYATFKSNIFRTPGAAAVLVALLLELKNELVHSFPNKTLKILFEGS